MKPDCPRALVAIVLTFYFTSPVLGAIPTTVTMNLDRLPQPGGTVLYELFIPGISFGDSLVAPSGRVYTTFPSPSTPLSVDQLATELFGNWKINSAALNLPGQPQQLHEFTISPIDFSNVFHAEPSIVAPLDGSTLLSPFAVHWQWPAGVRPPAGTSARAQGGSSNTQLTWGTATDNSYPVNVAFSGSTTQAQYTLRVGSFESLSDYVSPVRTMVFNPFREFTVRLGQSSLSLPVRVTVVVPEPAAASLLLVASFTLATRRRKPGEAAG